jgi:lipoprotein-releasing system ATP-binding protein
LTPLIRAEGLSKSYQTGETLLEVLRDVHFSISPGETTAVVGVSGVGKSTLLHILGTIDRPTSGRVYVEERDPFELSSADLARFRNEAIGFVFQFHHLLPEFTALENVMMPALIRRLSRREAKERAETLLEEVGISHRLGHRVGQLSGGETQRVAIARALVMEPRILLADEPTGNLDPRTASTVQDLLLDLNQRKKLTILMATHNEKMAEGMGRQLHLVDGKLNR